MDPLSIVASAAGLTSACIKLSTALYTFIDGARNVDSNVAGLYEETKGLAQVLEAINKSWNQSSATVLRQADLDGNLWSTVKASLDDCRTTLEKLDNELNGVPATGFLRKSFLRRPVTQIKFNMKMADIIVYKQRIHSHNSAMQSALQMISVCLLLQSGSAQGMVNKTLGKLRQEIGSIEAALRNRGYIPDASANLLVDDETITRNLTDLVRVAGNFHSSASTVVAEGSTWGGSVIGDPLDQERLQNIQDWIPAPVFDEEEVGDDGSMPRTPQGQSREEPFRVDQASAARPGSADSFPQSGSDSDSDFETELSRNLEQLALKSFLERDYQKAAEFFKEIRPRMSNSQNRLELDLRLAYCYCFQGNWDEAQDIITPKAAERGQPEIMVFHALHAIALFRYQTGKLDDAEQLCKKASSGKRRILSKEHASYYESLDILARISNDKGAAARAEGTRTFLPPEIAPSTLQPLIYLEKSMKAIEDQQVAAETVNTKPAVNAVRDIRAAYGTANSKPQDTNETGIRRYPLNHSPSKTLASSSDLTAMTSTPTRTLDQPDHSISPSNDSPGVNSSTLERRNNTEETAEPTSIINRTEPKIFVGINFGVPNTVIAFSVWNDNMDVVKDLRYPVPSVHSPIPSVVCYERNGAVAGWGTSSKAAYSRGQPGERFLYQINLQKTEKPYLPFARSPLKVIEDYFLGLLPWVETKLKEDLGSIAEGRPFHCYLTKPGIFAESSVEKLFPKVAMRASRATNIPVELVLEHEAMIYYALHKGYITRIPHIPWRSTGTFFVFDLGDMTSSCSFFSGNFHNPDGMRLNLIECIQIDEDGNSYKYRIIRKFQEIARVQADITGRRFNNQLMETATADFEKNILPGFANDGKVWRAGRGTSMPTGMDFSNDQIKKCFDTVVPTLTRTIQEKMPAHVDGGENLLMSILVTGALSRSDYIFYKVKLAFSPKHRSCITRFEGDEILYGAAEGSILKGISEQRRQLQQFPAEAMGFGMGLAAAGTACHVM